MKNKHINSIMADGSLSVIDGIFMSYDAHPVVEALRQSFIQFTETIMIVSEKSAYGERLETWRVNLN